MSTVILAGARGFLLLTAAVGFVVTALPAWPTDRWWVRYLDYPRLEILVAMAVVLPLLLLLSLVRYLAFYNERRPHSSLGARTPKRVYLNHLPQVDGSMTTLLAPWPCSSRTTPSLHEATVPTRHAYQPADEPLIEAETL